MRGLAGGYLDSLQHREALEVKPVVIDREDEEAGVASIARHSPEPVRSATVEAWALEEDLWLPGDGIAPRGEHHEVMQVARQENVSTANLLTAMLLLGPPEWCRRRTLVKVPMRNAENGPAHIENRGVIELVREVPSGIELRGLGDTLNVSMHEKSEVVGWAT